MWASSNGRTADCGSANLGSSPSAHLTGCSSAWSRALRSGRRGRESESRHPDQHFLRGVGEHGCPRQTGGLEIAGSNPAVPSPRSLTVECMLDTHVTQVRLLPWAPRRRSTAVVHLFGKEETAGSIPAAGSTIIAFLIYLLL